MKIKAKGFSLIEILLAGAIFMIFSWGVTEVLLTSLTLNRLGEETTIAKEYATAGIEAVHSIKTHDFNALNITNSTGIERQDGDWTFSGNDNTFDKYTRHITISEVSRDSNGDIVESGGDIDPETRKITVTVDWEFAPLRSNSVVLDTYITQWRN